MDKADSQRFVEWQDRALKAEAELKRGKDRVARCKELFGDQVAEWPDKLDRLLDAAQEQGKRVAALESALQAEKRLVAELRDMMKRSGQTAGLVTGAQVLKAANDRAGELQSALQAEKAAHEGARSKEQVERYCTTACQEEGDACYWCPLGDDHKRTEGNTP